MFFKIGALEKFAIFSWILRSFQEKLFYRTWRTSNNRELLSTIDKMSWKLHGQLTQISKYVNNKMQFMKTINQKAPNDSYKCFYKVLVCHVSSEGILLGVINFFFFLKRIAKSSKLALRPFSRMWSKITDFLGFRSSNKEASFWLSIISCIAATTRKFIH